MERLCLCQQTLSSVSENNICCDRFFFKAVAGEWPLTNRVADSGERGFPHIRLRSEGVNAFDLTASHGSLCSHEITTSASMEGLEFPRGAYMSFETDGRQSTIRGDIVI
jgi:hypothetical protein